MMTRYNRFMGEYDPDTEYQALDVAMFHGDAYYRVAPGKGVSPSDFGRSATWHRLNEDLSTLLELLGANEGVYELMRTVVGEGGENAFEITEDEMGNPLKLCAAFVAINTPKATDDTGAYVYFWCQKHQIGLTYTANVKQAPYERKSKSEAKQRFGKWDVLSYGSAATGGGGQLLVVVRDYMTDKIDDFPYIDKIIISSATSVTFDAGTEIIIEGVRA